MDQPFVSSPHIHNTFLTALKNTFENSSIAVSLFRTNVVFVKMVQYANWRYAVIKRRLVSPDLDKETINKIAGRMILSIFVHIAAVFAAFINTHLCFAMYLLFPVYYSWYDVYKKSHAAK